MPLAFEHYPKFYRLRIFKSIVKSISHLGKYTRVEDMAYCLLGIFDRNPSAMVEE